MLTWARSQLLPFWVALARTPLPESHSWSVKQRYAQVGWAAGSPVANEARARPELRSDEVIASRVGDMNWGI